MGAYETLGALLIRGLADEGDAEEMVDLTRRAMGLVAAGFSRQFDWEGEPLVAGDLSRWMQLYPDVGHDDPCVSFLESSPEGNWYFAARQVIRTDTQRAFVREEFADVAITRFSGPHGELLPCAFYRDRPARAFDEEDHAMLSRLVPLWAGALRTQAALHALGVVDRNTCPQLGTIDITFPNRRLVWTRRARQAFESRLGAISGRGWGRVERALLKAVSRSSPTMRRIPIIAGLSAEVAHVPPNPGETRRIRLLLFATTLPALGSADPRTPAEELLSPRQRAIARMVTRGWTSTEIANQLGIAAETVRQHVRTIYGRLGIRHRGELYELID
ncbi:MAG: LuxR C-terminal-related transcriptional regulator [Myxococcota bacterium]